MTDRPTTNSDEPVVRYHRPKAQLFEVLSLLWFLPSLGALLILGVGFRVWRQADSLGAMIAATRFEQWIALLLLVFHPVCYALARHYRKNEVPREIPPEEPEVKV